MSEVKVSNNPSVAKVEEDQSHSDSEASVEEPSPKVLKSEKKKSLSSNFGRPRKHPYKPGKYKCMYCETMCSKPSVLTKHLRAHTNERPFPCCICKRSFKTKSNLSKHEKSKSHSSRVGENHVERNQQSKREQAEMMLQQLTGVEPNSRDPLDHKSRIEFDSIEKKISSVNSNYSSPLASDDKSFDSDEICSDDNVKKEKVTEAASLSIGAQSLSEPAIESPSSCSGVLTINSNGGPITFEVQINLETMRHLQQGLSHMNSKRNCSSPIPPLATRNDAELRAAESILHMANQRSCLPDKIIQQDDIKKNGPYIRRIPRSLSPLNRNSPDIGICSKPNNVTKSSSIKDSNSNKSTPLEEIDPSNFKIHTKCLVKENLLKKMKKKQGQETHILSRNESPTVSVATSTNYGASTNKSFPERTIESVVTKVDPTVNRHLPIENLKKRFPEYTLKKCLNIFEKSPITSLAKAHILTSNPSILLINPLNNPTKSLIPDCKAISPITVESVAEAPTIIVPSTRSHLDIETVTLSKVITNTQSFDQHQENKSLQQENVSIINSFPGSQIVTNFSSSEDNDEVKIENINNSGATEYQKNEDEPHKVPYQKQISNQTTHESENESSPRLCIVEEPPVDEPMVVDQKVSESDEEIDVVNTDSDDDTLQRQRTSEVTYSDLSSKKRKYPCDEDNELIHKDVKHIKEIEKCVPLHAPNINAKDLMQDCPLNLSANRQPTIPPVSEIPVSVLQNLYQTIAPSIVTSSNMSSNTNETDSVINTLTNQNPAHPQSFQTFPTSNTPSLPSNGHHRDYPIFEDKVLCEVCSQMIEPSMLSLHKNMHIYTSNKDSSSHGTNNTKSGSSSVISNPTCSSSSKIPFNKPRSYKCVVCSIAFRVIGHLRKHHKSKTHLQGLVNSGLLSKSLYSKIEQFKVPIQEVIDQKTGNINPDVLSHYISDWSQTTAESEPH